MDCIGITRDFGMEKKELMMMGTACSKCRPSVHMPERLFGASNVQRESTHYGTQ